MAEKEQISLKNINPQDFLKKLIDEASFTKRSESLKRKLLASEAMDGYDKTFTELKPDNKDIYSAEMQRFYNSRRVYQNRTEVGTLPYDIERLRENIKLLEESCIKVNLHEKEQALEKLVYLGQELLRRKYLSKISEPENKIELSDTCSLITELGAVAIQVLGKAPRTPFYAFRKFSKSSSPSPKSTGIEILSSGAFPDWFDKTNRELKQKKGIGNSGFENVLEAAFDSPRSRVLGRAIRENKLKNIFSFPEYLRTMLDLELMRLGQATTPGTFSMLLNSYYYGAMLVDHSTNVSEQVQIIYSEENWKPLYTIENRKDPGQQAGETLSLLKEFFLTRNLSPIKQDHPRTARIEFTEDMEQNLIKAYFKELAKLIKSENGIRINNKVHQILPVLHLTLSTNRAESTKSAIRIIKSCGYKKLALSAEFVRNHPGLLQYFDNDKITNNVISYAGKNRIELTDGRTVDMVATSNKAIEAAAGAIMSGHGCIKVGLLGLTYEQMSEFISRFKKGLGTNYKRQSNQLIIFIGLVDKPIVSDSKIYTNPKEVSEKFIELMRKKRHDMLLLDTMYKGKKDKRFVSEKDINKKDEKGGHLTFNELKALIKKANKKIGGYPGCEIWVAGSYTEEQTYQASLESAEQRPGLICLGGAERSFGGIRLDPKDAYEINPNSRNKNEKLLASLIQFNSDIQFLLSRDNKLARDAGHVEGELKRKGKKEAGELKNLRKKYITARKNYYEKLFEEAQRREKNIKNIDSLVLIGDSLNISTLTKAKMEFQIIRKKYVERVSELMYQLFEKEWFRN
ncbi:MAG TPA: hypothetical protein VGK25_08470 [Ignavibacteria bacterium]